MNSNAGFGISGFWGQRRESSRALAERSLKALRGLAAIDPVFSDWFIGKNGSGHPLSIDLESLEVAMTRGSWEDGFTLDIKTQQRGSGPTNFNLDINGGLSYFQNSVVLGTDYGRKPDTTITRYKIFRGAILTIAETFQVERAFAYPVRIFDLRSPSPNSHPPFPISWISYVTPRLTHLVTPPTTAIVEHRPDGGLLMSATDDVFDVGNERHMSVARDIATGAKALDGRPWEPE